MKKREIMQKYSIGRSLFGRLVHAGYLIWLSKDNYGINHKLMKNFNIDTIDEELKERRNNDEEYKRWRSERASAANRKRWDNTSEEQKALWQQKVSKGVRKAQKERPECIEQMKSSLKEYWADDTHRKEQSEKLHIAYQDAQKRANLKRGINEYWSKEENRLAASERHKGYYDDKPELLARMRENNRKAQLALWTEEKRREHSEKLKALWQQKGDEFRAKTREAQKSHEYSKESKPARECRESLEALGFTVIKEYPYPQKNWGCDAYIVELDTYIEFHFGFYHNFKPFDPTNEEHVKEAEYLEKTYGYDRNSKNAHRFYNWTDLDVRKREYAKESGITWFEFYSKGEFERWLNALMS